MDIRLAILSFVALVVSIIVHEIAHGVAAASLGDHTARNAGRLSPNPLRHIDPFGSLLLPAMGAFTGLPVLGWAKPVPVNRNALRNPRRDMLLVSLAGPGSNLVMAVGFALMARLLLGLGGPGNPVLALGLDLAYAFAAVNVLLAVFNLLPTPPLDGSAIFELFMPLRWQARWDRFRPFGLLVLMGLVFFLPGVLDRIFEPFMTALRSFIVG